MPLIVLFFPTRFTRIIFGVVSIISIFLVLVNCQSDTLAFTGVLTSGQSLTSADGYYQLILQSSGALIGYSISDSATFWTAGPSNGSPAGTATLSGTTGLSEEQLGKIQATDMMLRTRHKHLDEQLPFEVRDVVRRKRMIYRSKQRGTNTMLRGSYALHSSLKCM